MKELVSVSRMSRTTLTKVRDGSGHIRNNTSDRLFEIFGSEFTIDSKEHSELSAIWNLCRVRSTSSNQAEPSGEPTNAAFPLIGQLEPTGSQERASARLLATGSAKAHAKLFRQRGSANHYDKHALLCIESLLSDLNEAWISDCQEAIQKRSYSAAKLIATKQNALFGDEWSLKRKSMVAQLIGELELALFDLPSSVNSFKFSLSLYKSWSTLARVGEVFWELGQYQAAIGVETEMLDQTLAKFGTKHANAGDAYNNLGVSYAALARFAESEYFYERAIEIRYEHLQDDPDKYGRTLNNYYAMLVRSGRLTEAELFRKSVVDFRENLHREATSIRKQNERRIDLSRTLVISGVHYALTSDFEEALANFDRALSIRRELLGKFNGLYAQSLFERAKFCALNSIGDNSTSIDDLTRSVELTKQIYGEHHVDYGIRIGALARAKLQLGDSQAAKGLARIAVQVVGAQHDKSHIDFLEVVSVLDDVNSSDS